MKPQICVLWLFLRNFYDICASVLNVGLRVVTYFHAPFAIVSLRLSPPPSQSFGFWPKQILERLRVITVSEGNTRKYEGPVHTALFLL